MKINVTLQIDVDPAEWDAVYGTGTDASAVREDVKTYVLGAVESSAGIGESGATVALR